MPHTCLHLQKSRRVTDEVSARACVLHAFSVDGHIEGETRVAQLEDTDVDLDDQVRTDSQRSRDQVRPAQQTADAVEDRRSADMPTLAHSGTSPYTWTRLWEKRFKPIGLMLNSQRSSSKAFVAKKSTVDHLFSKAKISKHQHRNEISDSLRSFCYLNRLITLLLLFVFGI